MVTATSLQKKATPTKELVCEHDIYILIYVYIYMYVCVCVCVCVCFMACCNLQHSICVVCMGVFSGDFSLFIDPFYHCTFSDGLVQVMDMSREGVLVGLLNIIVSLLGATDIM